MKKFLSLVLALGVLVAVAVFPGRILALTSEQIQAINAQIQALLAQVQQLQSQLNATNVGVSGANSGSTGLSVMATGSNLAVGDYIRTSDFLNVRETPNGRVVSTQFIAATGRIKAGPVAVNGLTWWEVDYTSPPDGWSAEKDSNGRVLLVKSAPPATNTNPGAGAGNSVPVLGTVTGSASVIVGTAGVWQVSATDSNGGTLNYAVNWGDGTSTPYQGTSGQVINITHTYAQAGARNITVSVSDGQTTVTGNPFALTVGTSGGSNQAPTLDPLTAPTEVAIGVNTTWQVRAVDPEGSALTYMVNWGDGTAVSTYTSKPSGQSVPVTHTYATAGTKTIMVTATDSQLTSVPQTLLVMVVVGVVQNQNPSIISFTGNTGFLLNVSGDLFVRASDPNGDALNYAVTWGDGTSNNFNGASGQEVKITHAYTTISSNAGVYSIKVVVTDGKGGRDEENYIVNVSTNQDTGYYPPSRPVVAGPNQIVAGTNGIWLVTFNDLDSTSLTYIVDFRDGSTPVSGTVTSGQTLTFPHVYTTVNRYQSLLVTVSDGRSTETASPFINVTAPPRPPTISSVSGPTDTKAATTRTWSVTGTDPEGAVLNYVFNWGDGTTSNYTNKTSGVSFSASHVYAQPGTFSISVTATDNSGLSVVSSPYSVRVNKFAVNDRVEVSSSITSLAVRATPDPNGTWIGGVKPLSQYGSKGTILEGPVVAGGYTWWKIAWDYTMTGWSAENWIVKTQ